MPELPEVETVVRDLRRAGLENRQIRRVLVGWPRIVAGVTAAGLAKALEGTVIRGISRRAKFIVIELDRRRFLLIHLRRTGRFALDRRFERRTPHEHVILELDDGRTLHFEDPRKFGRWVLTTTPERDLGRLGPEPLEPSFTRERFAERMRRFRRQLKPLLLDQSFVAGIGNIYADEALWTARLHPCRRSDSLSGQEIARLHKAIRAVLMRGVRNQGTSLGTASTNFYSAGGRRGRNQDGLNVFRRDGEACPACQSTILRLVVGQRGTHICPKCQPAPRHGRR